MKYLFVLIAMLIASPALAADPSAATFWDGFGTEFGDAYSSVILHEIFGPLFPSAAGASGPTVFSQIIGYLNFACVAVGGVLFFYNVTVGVMQSAHEGEVLGKRWSSLWAPLRVLFGVGLLIPLPGLGGYNLGQAGIAYIVKGATASASLVWTAAAETVISDDIPLAASAPSVSPGLIRDLYANAGCMKLVQYQLDIASGYAADNSKPRPVIGYHRMESVTPGHGSRARVQVLRRNGELVSYAPPESIAVTTAITHPGDDAKTFPGLCGGWQTPDMPIYLTDLGADGTALREAFSTGHAVLIDTVAAEMSALSGTHFEDARNGRDMADVSGEIARITRDANGAMSEFMVELRAAAIEASGADDGRDMLLDRIRGDADCTGPDCLGEGWIGAGTWYITLARLNNRLSSVIEARPETDGPQLSASPEDLFEEAGGRATGRKWLGLGSYVSADDVEGMAAASEMTRTLEGYDRQFAESSGKLAALGFPLDAATVAEINSDAADSIWDRVPGAQAMLTNLHGILLSALEPGNFADDPMIGLTSIGKFLITFAFALIGVSTLAGLATGGALAVSFGPIITAMIGAGVVLSFVLPIMPFIFWLLGVTGYFLVVIEAVIAINLFALSHMRMDGEGISGEAGRNGWLLMLTLAFTPMLMIFGFIAGMVIFRVSDALLSAGFFYAVEGVIGGDFTFGFVAIIGYAVLMALIYVVLLERSFSLITELPARVLRWMGDRDQVVSNTYAVAPVRPGARLPVGSPGGGAAPGGGGLPKPSGGGEPKPTGGGVPKPTGGNSNPRPPVGGG
ncbi:DotA/TraY family protein [Roseovarius sp.]|uniref:DotA/TraY family protein n=1 Tax=Roseovarius sp. TaxID=1486281 RepID=UPI003BADB1E1